MQKTGTPTLETALTAPLAHPDGDGWRCIHSGCSPDGTRWWLWHRVVWS